MNPPTTNSCSTPNDASSCYWDARSMAPLNAVSRAAVARLRAYAPPPFPLWAQLPRARRAAVLVLLFADRRGELRVVVTLRAASLRSFSGDAAFPGGKADSVEESAYDIARREACEEIGLPRTVPPPFRIELLCELPHTLARSKLVVRPCVALLSTSFSEPPPSGDSPSGDLSSAGDSLAGAALGPRLDAREVAAVFSAPFAAFLSAGASGAADPRWYSGFWRDFLGEPWRVHHFFVPAAGQRVARPETQEGEPEVGSSEGAADAYAGAPAGTPVEIARGDDERFKVWGMTAHIMVDAARIAYGRDPDFEHNAHFGDEELIRSVAAEWEEEPKI